jgi:hypothetical protein
MRIQDINFSMKKERRGPKTPIRMEAKGSMMTVEEELRKTPV